MRKQPCSVFQRTSFHDGPGRQCSRSYHLGTTRSIEVAIMIHDPFQYVPALRSIWDRYIVGWVTVGEGL